MEAATKKGRPQIAQTGRDFGILDDIRKSWPGISERAAQNKMYQIIGSSYVIEHRESIPHAERISFDDEPNHSRYIPAQGVAEQLGRMIAQDEIPEDGNLIFSVAVKAAEMLHQGETVKTVEHWIREGRKHGSDNFTTV